ncbi:MAG: hypothetical protein A2513_01945 [Sulfurimonas sp. RIFOXYD12_FULL_33_39]|uniref:hypothetical protein n=1 Tax=unclassified Sulfurimonas TaxID=2623549 RepID=UPI0008BCE4A6|nr:MULTISPECIES: hypothetical protein [unclassified Sulfurimonas]OHE04028.1 MAG: hypothetical protein A3G74_00785 [Sulfurimonas sp. RIFCSPLOWO2_12_FULL_34_6]OHE08757.1 MAG: hypothetical protein A2513_01945 [Sulfurimonas sp. RIFOXYD12_FULL_33_39]OHE14042.1 MAG: hypothetical protein A2530_03270 [Sulfurimonas sp. RIFOXYD2_FULL_34_21]DAB27648.1 MAG TPA: hypothetical protein CFH78_06790 [Sulfurimonas sp. UBA10385]
MRLTIDEYCKHFKMSKEMVSSKIRTKKLDYLIEEGQTYIVVTKDLFDKYNKDENYQEKNIIVKDNSQIIKPKTTVATVLALYQKENRFLKDKIVQLEAKIDKLIDDKEQMLRDERDKIEHIYSSKDTQLKNILELINKKLSLEKEQIVTTIHEVESFHYHNEEEIFEPKMVELKEYLRTLNIKSSQRKIIKKRFLDIYDSDIRVIHKDGKLYLDFSKYDYSDLLAY